MRKKKVFIVLSSIGILLLVIGVSFAYWTLMFTQKENNVVITDCFEIEFLEGERIHLTGVYPIFDEEGMENPPYTFTIKNVCEGSANYQINLEALEVTGKKRMPDQYLKANIMEGNESRRTSKLDNSLATSTTIEGAVSAYKLLVGTLLPNETKNFSLRLWMHEDVTADMEDSMDASFQGKVSVITSYIVTLPTLADTVQSIPVVTSGNGLYEISHEDAEITYTTDETIIQNLKQTELRYAGANPNNYVWFNDELWRMIGFVNTPEGQRMKLVRKEGIGEYSWDSSDSSVNSGEGVNEWSTSKLMELLNHGAYYNRESGLCYNGANNQTVACDFSESGLSDEAKEMIDTVTWNTGSNDGTTYIYNNINTKNFYHLERSNNTGKICNPDEFCNDAVPRNTTWVGKVGLMYPSDYGYATSGGSATNKEGCLYTALYSWGYEGVSDCKDNDWLYVPGQFRWTLTSFATYMNANIAFYMNHALDVNHTVISDFINVVPAVFLKTNVRIESGNGTMDSPYILLA